ncbi:MAG: DUF5368 domain-containing protein [Pseudomonadota bacterium]
MQDITFETLLAVMQEIFGTALFWALVTAGVLVTLAYLYVLVRDRAVSWRKFLWAQLAMPFGAVAAVALVMGVTDSGLSDLGGPIDILLVVLIAAAGAVGLAVLVYTVQSLSGLGRAGGDTAAP